MTTHTSPTPAGRGRRRPSPALVVAVLALVVALGGTSYAALKLPKNSVGASQIRSNAVSSPTVKDGSLLAKDFKKGQLPKGERGLQGVPGKQGVAGTARAHATIRSNGLVTPEFIGSHPGFTKVERSPANFPGFFCLTPATGIPSVNSDAVVSADAKGSETMATYVAAYSSIGTIGNDPACPDGTIEVETDRLATGDGNNLTSTNNIDFSIIVP
jgi:hypothetical protein